VFVDERADSLDDSYCGTVAMEKDALANTPASYHNGACGFAFADGHSETHKWLDPRTKPPVDPSQYRASLRPSPGNPDVKWLQEHSTYLK
jgi:prepilin-type processing-associated H-X9-DG protein